MGIRLVCCLHKQLQNHPARPWVRFDVVCAWEGATLQRRACIMSLVLLTTVSTVTSLLCSLLNVFTSPLGHLKRLSGRTRSHSTVRESWAQGTCQVIRKSLFLCEFYAPSPIWKSVPVIPATVLTGLSQVRNASSPRLSPLFFDPEVQSWKEP